MTSRNVTEAPMVTVISKTIRLLTGDEKLVKIYVKGVNLFNYAIVCGIGVGINMAVIHALINIFPLWLANLCAILTAFLWNWSMSVGPYGWLWGLGSRSSTTLKDLKEVLEDLRKKKAKEGKEVD